MWYNLTQLAKKNGGERMASTEEIELLLDKLKKAPPSEHFQKADMNVAGIRAILKILNEADGKVTAGRISTLMHVSTARVAVLLKKMEAKGLIEKEQDFEDRRVVVVKLSKRGKETADRLRDDLYRNIASIIDRVGMERMLEFAEISKEIHAAIKKPDVDV